MHLAFAAGLAFDDIFRSDRETFWEATRLHDNPPPQIDKTDG